ncbi:Glutaredoxin, GrxC family [Spongiibacter sp. IMCC21906]|jgi:glutaredoxin 3|uniref:glutaredoxin 3 n=1 Tax=Spongiibacter sp. IMCC21906 TaxID=1620392 RepID=UPI00062DEE6D|nr:glutaredoxin 3 [Spongiibacter sp. IMCC21906]AKH68517.1 Glutaredoxin, GrxC family [Spongiibacter sp. IMCC21906]
MTDVTIYTTRFCPFCVRAKHVLTNKGVAFKEIPVDGDNAMRRELQERSGQRTVPQIWIGEQHIGGCDELMALDRQGQLDVMLAE